MKDYLNNEERKNIITILHLMTSGVILLEGNTLTKDEKANLKRGFTFTKKAIENIKNRLNKNALNALDKDAKKSRVLLDIYGATREYERRKQSDINAAYEENRDYYKLVELILFYNCKNCSEKCNECEIYKEFEERCIPEFEGAEKMGYCKYSYKG
ncbi:DUF5651 domain-containing protein [Clostridium septicum]|uniref:DUF5651 domain-containing protein n=1 Tax=Clostridium septicum TaxID=1504 RepID=A0A9N7PM10_CLOSE|nr:DUF5651 domain-containing protein [Clostridium septicum]AYE35281.1 hypothetical protein CP523_13080 [Clostridium septicum]MDU1313909.1 DUF5651 domain-containing protein [Clostridium septicum]QAS60675.1 hypothetical protein EI377_07950 [Clostridium septicum]UEC20067.1 DUF5651 domain-containing protein [Clostridium septicum]USS01877.1 DUF5651 domain-containing protein [Clostridium septicum]